MGKSYPDQVRAAERREIRRRYRKKRKPGIPALRRAELDREFTDRYGGEILPDDDAGRDDVKIMLNTMARRPGDQTAQMAQWLDSRAPWWGGEGRAALIARIFDHPLRYRADTVAKKIGLTAARRKKLNIRTIGAIDQTAAERNEARRLNGIERKRTARRTAGIQPRPKPDGKSINARAPWKAVGIHRSTWFRRQARDRATSNAAV